MRTTIASRGLVVQGLTTLELDYEWPSVLACATPRVAAVPLRFQGHCLRCSGVG
jgi:hypothetical protein